MWRSALSRPSRWLVCAVFLSSAIGTDALAQDGTGALEAGGAELALVPVGSSAPHVINGNEITIPSIAATVELEIRASGLQKSGERCIVAYGVQIDSAGYLSGLSGTLTPAQIACATDDDCYGDSVCASGTCDATAAAFIDRERADFLFAGLPGIVSVDLSTPDYRYVSTMFFCTTSDGGYCGTLILNVPENASGAFSVPFRPHPDTGVLYGSNQKILPLTLTPALITITPPVCGNFACEVDENDQNCPLDCLEHGLPTVSIWGLAIQALLLLTAAKVSSRFRVDRRPVPDARRPTSVQAQAEGDRA